jgi:hypothetical protein
MVGTREWQNMHGLQLCVRHCRLVHCLLVLRLTLC